jgi:hypothetical protein
MKIKAVTTPYDALCKDNSVICATRMKPLIHSMLHGAAAYFIGMLQIRGSYIWYFIQAAVSL